MSRLHRDHSLDKIFATLLANEIREAARSRNIRRLQVLCNGHREGLLGLREVMVMVRSNLPGSEKELQRDLDRIFGENGWGDQRHSGGRASS